MKKLLVMLCCMGGFLLLSCPAFAQKGSCTYWGGSYTFKTYEPWLYEIVKQNKQENKADETVQSFWKTQKDVIFKSSKIQLQSLVESDYYQTNKTHNEDAVFSAFLDKMMLLSDLQAFIGINPLFKNKYAVLVKPENHFFLTVDNHTLYFVKELFIKDPTDRKGRPEPADAWKDKYTGHIWVEFEVINHMHKPTGKILQICFDLKNHTIEFFNEEANFKKPEDSNLMDVANYHTFAR